MYRMQDIKSVHLEITTLCNAKCPMCARTMPKGEVNRYLPLRELTIADIRKIFSQEFLHQLAEIYLCGNYGDPIAAKSTLEALKYFKFCNPKIVTKIHTNGAVRAASWWQDLAQCCDQVYFGIDGLEDTNSLYRIGTDFYRIMENAQAYIDAGGVAKWQYIVFRHNEHQIDEARKRANLMGFKEFNVKKTGRFFSNTKMQVRQDKEVLDAQGVQTHTLEMPTEERWRNQALKNEMHLLEKYGSMANYLDHTQIHCQAVDTKSIYISADGMVFPCCWVANQMYVWFQEPRSNELWQTLSQLPQGSQSLSALQHELETIVEGPYFQQILPRAWQQKSVKSGKPWVCAKTCGKEFNQFKEQFGTNKKLEEARQSQ